MKARIIDVEICKEYFNYDDEGNLYWKKKSKNSRIKIGDRVGYMSQKYYRFELNSFGFYVHRVLYQLYHNITLNEYQQVDHIDMNKTNNRKDNLRLADNSENQCNRKCQKSNRSTGIKNISIHKTHNLEYYKLQVKKIGTSITKYFRTDVYDLEYVIKIRDELLKELHGEFSNKG